MYDGRTKLADQVTTEVRKHFGDTVLRTVIPRSVKVSEAPGYSQTVLGYDPGSRGAMSYVDAAREIAERGAASGTRPRTGGRRGGRAEGRARPRAGRPDPDRPAPAGRLRRRRRPAPAGPLGRRPDRDPFGGPPGTAPVAPDRSTWNSGGGRTTARSTSRDRAEPAAAAHRRSTRRRSPSSSTRSASSGCCSRSSSARSAPGAYELVMGERRWRAAQRAGLARIPAIVRRTGDDTMLRDALLENIHRVQLNPLEEAAAYEQLLVEFGVTHDRARRPARPQPAGGHEHHPAAQAAGDRAAPGRGRGAVGRARPRAARPGGRGAAGGPRGPDRRRGAVGAGDRGGGARWPGARSRPRRGRHAGSRRCRLRGLHDLAERLSDTFDTRVQVELGQRKGRIVVEFGSVDDLERIAALMGGALGEQL